MSLREDVKFMLDKDWEPKVPNKEIILEQSKMQMKKGKSTGNVALDTKAMEAMRDDKGR